MKVFILDNGLDEITARVTLPAAEGFVTLRRDSRGIFDAWGDCPAHWCDDSLWRALGGDVDEMIEAVRQAAASSTRVDGPVRAWP